MKFFHVYNDECFKGLELNGLINKDSGFKIQHAYSVPKELLFNTYAAEGSKLYNFIKEGSFPFYVDRIAGGIYYFPYKFDCQLIAKYREMLGDDFYGFQLHESASNLRVCDWPPILAATGSKGPYDPVELREKLAEKYSELPNGICVCLSHGTPESFAKLAYAETYKDFFREVQGMFQTRYDETYGNILPCDSVYLFTKTQVEMGMRTFMIEIGSQLAMGRIPVALLRGMAKSYGKTWGVYYECWRNINGVECCMPCFNSDPVNEWYLPQEQFPHDFSKFGENGGSSRFLQNRIYYYALMSGADYLSEEWGLNCSYTNMQTFELSSYGQVKKDFIRSAEKLRGIRAVTPFAIVLPKKYLCVELPELYRPEKYKTYKYGFHRDEYMLSPLNAAEKEYFGHIEDVLKLFYIQYGETYGNEGHTLTNSRFGDIFDIIYEDVDDAALSQYEYLIDATKEGSFIKAKSNSSFRILDSFDLGSLENKVHELEKTCMPCVVDGLHWIVSVDENGQRYLTIFNNEGNERDISIGDIIDRHADRTVKVSFKNEASLNKIHGTDNGFKIERIDLCNYYVTVPAAGFAVMTF